MKISVKTRIGIEDAEEFEDLQKVFQQYPFAEVIVHPRVRSDFYKNQPDRQVFGAFLKESVNPVCYNGDIFTVSDAGVKSRISGIRKHHVRKRAVKQSGTGA